MGTNVLLQDFTKMWVAAQERKHTAHRWRILAAMELHASLCGTMVSYEDLSRSYGLPSGVDLPPHQDHAIVQ